MNQEKIGQMIKEIRNENKLTQQEFASLFGVTYQAVSKWENGKNIPDIAILTAICNTYHYDIHDFLNGEKKKKKIAKVFFIPLLCVILFFIISLGFFLFHKDTFTFKTLSSNCENFDITGSIAYNKEKTSIYISNISYCGKQEKKNYQKIECSLYEANENTITKIDDYIFQEQKETSLEELLKNVKFQVDDYNKTCKHYKENTLYLEMLTYDMKGETHFYKIPLKLQDNCNSTLS